MDATATGGPRFASPATGTPEAPWAPALVLAAAAPGAVIVLRRRCQPRHALRYPQTQRNYARWARLLEADPDWVDVAYTNYIGHPLTQTATAPES